MSEFKKELEILINKHSIENESDTPDFILANYIAMCLDAYNATIKSRELWYGRNIETKEEIIIENKNHNIL